jgi:starch synthase
MEKNIKVLFASSECSPFVKVGGLADVVGSLPVELNKQGVDARVIIPLYKKIKRVVVRRREFDKTSGRKIKRFVEENKNA